MDSNIDLNFDTKSRETAQPVGPSILKKDSEIINFEAPVSNYEPAISRKLMEGITGLSAKTLIKYTTEEIIHPKKTKYGALEMVTYSAGDVQAVLKHRGVSYKKKKEAEVIAIFSQKGGVGKSAFTQHLGSMLSLLGRTLVIDLDAQSDATTLFDINVQYADLVNPDAELDPTIAELMDWRIQPGQEDKVDVEDVPQKRSFEQVVKKITPTLHVIPSDLDLGEINYSLNRLPLADRVDADGRLQVGAVAMIKEVIEKIKFDYDYILFDCPPNIEACNVSALYAANRVVIPLELEAKCIKIMSRNVAFLERLRSLDDRFSWDKILVVPNKFRRENIKIKALAKLQDIYEGRTDVHLSMAVFPNAAIIDKCSDNKEPIFQLASKFGKEFKSELPKAKEFTNLFWVVLNEILDMNLDEVQLLFPEENQVEA